MPITIFNEFPARFAMCWALVRIQWFEIIEPHTRWADEPQGWIETMYGISPNFTSLPPMIEGDARELLNGFKVMEYCNFAYDIEN